MVTPGLSWDGVLREDPIYPWGMARNGRMTQTEFVDVRGQKHLWEYYLNQDGMRGPEVLEKGARVRILAIGDSRTFGVYVQDSESWPAQLQQLLDPDGTNIDVLNGGVPGSTAMQGYGLLVRERLKLQPDVVVVTFGYNDGDAPGFNDLKIAQQNMGFGERVSASDLLRALDPSTVPEAKPECRVSEGEFFDVLTALASVCKRNGARVLFHSWPHRGAIEHGYSTAYLKLIETVAWHTESEFIDLLPIFRASTQDVLLDDVHATVEGMAMVAKAVKERLVKMGVVSGASRT